VYKKGKVVGTVNSTSAVHISAGRFCLPPADTRWYDCVLRRIPAFQAKKAKLLSTLVVRLVVIAIDIVTGALERP
jgi:hypothetical protein